MIRLKVKVLVVAVALGALAVLAPRAGSPGEEVDRVYKALDVRVRDVVDTYLRTDCEIGEVGVALKAVVAIGEAVRPYLQAVVREGPPSVVLQDFERGLESTWQSRQAFLKTPEARELGEASFKMMTAITKEQYLKDQRAAIQAKYRERAELALKAIEDAKKAKRSS